MEKKKAILKIESFSTSDGILVLSVKDFGVRAMLKGLIDLCKGKYSGFIKLEMSPPYRPRSLNQNAMIWGLIQQIAEETGNEIEDIEDCIKERAIKRGYPYKVNKLTGERKPASMTTINTVEAGYLIDEIYALAAEYGIELDDK